MRSDKDDFIKDYKTNSEILKGRLQVHLFNLVLIVEHLLRVECSTELLEVDFAVPVGVYERHEAPQIVSSHPDLKAYEDALELQLREHAVPILVKELEEGLDVDASLCDPFPELLLDAEVLFLTLFDLLLPLLLLGCVGWKSNCGVDLSEQTQDVLSHRLNSRGASFGQRQGFDDVGRALPLAVGNLLYVIIEDKGFHDVKLEVPQSNVQWGVLEPLGLLVCLESPCLNALFELGKIPFLRIVPYRLKAETALSIVLSGGLVLAVGLQPDSLLISIELANQHVDEVPLLVDDSPVKHVSLGQVDL